MIYQRLNNSVFIIDMVTVFYLFPFYVINPLKRCIVYPCKFFWLFMLSAKEALIPIFNLSPPPNLSLNV